MRTVITIASDSVAKLSGEFTPDKKPRIEDSEIFGIPIEDHAGTVVWTAPIRLAADGTSDRAEIEVTFKGIVSHDRGVGMPIANHAITAYFTGFCEDNYRGPRSVSSKR